LNRRLIFAAVVVALVALPIVAVLYFVPRQEAAAPKRANGGVNALTPVPATSWNETYPALQLFAPPKDGQRDTAFLSLAIAELPAAMVKNGATVHLLVAVPDWVVFDASGKVNPYADGVLLTATDPDVGIGLEFNRLELNPHQRAGERKWNALEVKLPPCTRRLALEARPGVAPGSNNAYDQLLINVREALVFRDGTKASSQQAPCPEAGPGGDCEQRVPPNCVAGEWNAGARATGGALHTGRK